MSDPTLSDIDFENKMAWFWTTLKETDNLRGPNFNLITQREIFFIEKYPVWDGNNFVLILNNFDFWHKNTKKF